jgi:hypothetical protein
VVVEEKVKVNDNANVTLLASKGCVRDTDDEKVGISEK